MPKIDDAAEIRALAYQIWEQEGRPSGREHEHWAEANRVYAALHPVTIRAPESQSNETAMFVPAFSEVERLRQALWTPEPFSRELFPNEVSEAQGFWRRRRTMPATDAAREADLSSVRTASGRRF